MRWSRRNRPWADLDRQLSATLSSYWTNFAANGDPNGKGLPKWPAYNTDQRATMIINDEWKVVNDPRHDIRMLMQSLKGQTAS